MRGIERRSRIICVCLCVYSGNSESGTFSLGLFSSVYGEWWGTTLPERKASFPSLNPLPSPADGERSVSNLCFHPVPHKHKCRKAGVCVWMGVFQIIHRHTHIQNKGRQTNHVQMSQNISEGSDSTALPVFTSCNRPSLMKKLSTKRRRKEGQASSKPHSTDLLLLL